MDRRRLFLVTLLALAGCGPDFPLRLRVDSAFSDAEAATVTEQIGKVNALGQELLGHDLIAYEGRFADGDAFQLDDFGDGVSVIYRMSSPEKCYDYLQNEYGAPEGGYVLGYGPKSDILIFVFNMVQNAPDGSWCGTSYMSDALEKWHAEHPDDCRPEDGCNWTPFPVCASPDYPIYEPELAGTVLHEMGHYIGLGHNKDKEALMYPFSNGLTDFTDKDKQAFCCLYRCVTDKYRCDPGF